MSTLGFEWKFRHFQTFFIQFLCKYCTQTLFWWISSCFFSQRAHDVVTRPPVHSAERSARRSLSKTRYPVGRREKRSPNTVIYKWQHASTTTRRPPRLKTRRKVRIFSFLCSEISSKRLPASSPIIWNDFNFFLPHNLSFDIRFTLRSFKRLACCQCNSGVLSLKNT